MFEREISHEGLHKRYLVKGEFPEIVDVLAEMRIRAWNERWERGQATQAERRDKFLSAVRETGPGRCSMDIGTLKDLTADRTRECEEAINALEHLLRDSLEEDHSIDWDLLMCESSYAPKPLEPHSAPAAREPDTSDEEFQPRVYLLSRIVSSLREKEREKAARRFADAKEKWSELSGDAKRLQKELTEWEARRRIWLAAIERWKRAYLACDPKSIPDYCKLVLAGSKYPDSFPHDAAIRLHSRFADSGC